MGVQNRIALDIKFSVAKTEVTWRLLSLQKANECCAIKELRKKSVWKEKKNWELAQVSVSSWAGPSMKAATSTRMTELTGIQAN